MPPNGEEVSEEREERGKRGAGMPLHAKTTAQIGITEHPQFFGIKISVMDAIQDEPFERFMSYFCMQIPMEGLESTNFKSGETINNFRKLKIQNNRK